MNSTQTRPRFLHTALCILPFLLRLTYVSAHAMLDTPNCRGGLNNRHLTNVIDRNAPQDYSLHFPAGLKERWAGAGFTSQLRAANFNWTPFRPLDRNFRWRAGVCGDTVRGRDHLIGGRFSYPRWEPHVVARYRSGDVIDASIKVVAHHNGFVEFHLCDVSKCGGDINVDCFRKGHCIQLRRAHNPICDSGYNKRCGPIDRNYPGRWYLPCGNFRDGQWERFGPGTMKYVIPHNFSCKKCVLHWFYTAANTCNPPGVVPYFEGPDRPRAWGHCRGQGGARGGVAWLQKPCGGRRLPEEYYNCADISVHAGGRSRHRGW